MTIARPPAARRGFALIELMVAVTGVAVILGLCAVTIQALLRVNADTQAKLNASATFARLASQFRADVHACDEVQLPAGANASARLRLTRGTRMVIDYQASPGRVVRNESTSGTVSRHESYRIGQGKIVVFERREDGSHPFLALVMSRDTGKDPLEPPRPLEVLAFPGKDRPAASPPKGGARP